MANEWKSKISAIFAEQGDTVDIPVETQADNQVSFATGYTKNYNKDAKDDLGNPLVKFGIERTKFNYLFKIITSAIKELQETLPVYTTDTDEQKVDVGAIVENTVAFNALTNLLCIDDTGKASKITKEELIAQLNPNVDLSNSNISVTAIADTALNNFLAIDGTTVKKANKLLQEVIEEIDLSADNVKVTKETTYADSHKILVVNSAGATHKVDKLLQSAIDEINLSADNISIEHTNTEATTLKPLMVDENGKITSEDNISSNLVKGDMFAKGFKTIVMTKEQYPNGIDDLTATGLYSLASMDEYKDIVNDSLPSERKEYIKMVLGQILTLLNYSDEQTANLDITKFSDLIYCPTHQIQVVGVSQGDTDNTIIQQSFILFGITLGTRTGTMTLNNVEFNDIVKMNGLPYIPINVKTTDNLNIQIIDDTSPITSFDEITENGYYQINKDLANKPDFNEGFYLLVMDLFGTIPIKMQILFKGLFYNPHFTSRVYIDNSWVEWSVDKINQTDINDIDLSADNIKVSKTITQTAVNTLLVTDTAGRTFKVEKNNIVNGIVSEVNAGIDLANYYTRTETDDKLSEKSDTNHTHSNYFDKDSDKIDLSSRVTGQLQTANIADNAITSAKIARKTITAADIADNTITAAQIAAKAVTASELASNSITNAKIANNAVTDAKFSGTLSAAKGGTPLVYTNNDGIWTETTLSTGEVMLEGFIGISKYFNSGTTVISLPKQCKNYTVLAEGFNFDTATKKDVLAVVNSTRITIYNKTASSSSVYWHFKGIIQ